MMLWQRLEDEATELKGLLDYDITSFKDYILYFQNLGQVKSDVKPEFIYYFITTNASSVFLDQPDFTKGADSQNCKSQYLELIIDIIYNAFKECGSS